MQELIAPGLPVEIPGGLVQYPILFWSTVVVIITAAFGWWLARKPRKYPGRRQVAAELLVGWFDGLCRDLLGRTRGRKYLAVFGTLFLFLVVSNMIGLIPLHGLLPGLFPRRGLEIGGQPYRDFNDSGAWEPGEPVVEFGQTDWSRERSPGFLVPAPEEPTRNINVPMGLSLFLGLGMYLAALRIKGALASGKQLFEPFWPMFPLNLRGQVAQIVSVSFRLFGNIFGGAVILIVVGGLIHHVLVPVPLALFVGVFVGVIQAFVFTMLWLTYHAEWVGEEG